jgi:inner membrane protein
MEPVTHFLTGACLGRSGFNRKTAYATLAMVLAAEAPDIDTLWGLRGPVAGFEHHRGITHTLVAAPVIALVVTGIVWGVHRMRKKPPALAPRWLLIWLFALIADLSHLLLDFTNNYGLRPFFPFNPRWHAWSIVFIFDGWLFLALVAALVMPWLFGLADREIGARRKPFSGRGWAIAALVFMVLWWGLRNAEHGHAIELVRNGGIVADPTQIIQAEPYPFSPFHWHVIAETRDYYQTADVETLHDQVQSDASANIYKPQVTPAVMTAKQSWLGRVYLDWSKLPVVTDLGNVPVEGGPEPQADWHTVEFEDLRFAYPAVGTGGESSPPLVGSVYIGPGAISSGSIRPGGSIPGGSSPGVGGVVEGMMMNGRQQK